MLVLTVALVYLTARRTQAEVCYTPEYRIRQKGNLYFAQRKYTDGWRDMSWRPCDTLGQCRARLNAHATYVEPEDVYHEYQPPERGTK
jgi:hypothetical protein